jgi:hypothetical protein
VTSINLRFSSLVATVALAITGCTTSPVDPLTVSKFKSISVTRVELPEYSYVGLDGEAAAKSAGVIVGYFAFGVFGLAAGDVMRAQSEQPYRTAIRDALATDQPNFERTINQQLDAGLKARGANTSFISPPPRLPDNSGYDYANASTDADAVLEIYPLVVGFSYQSGEAAPMIDIRWRLLARYPNGKLIETNRGSVVHRNTQTVVGQVGDAIPPNPAYKFKGHVSELKTHGERPRLAMQELATQAARVIVERAYPVATVSK